MKKKKKKSRTAMSRKPSAAEAVSTGSSRPTTALSSPTRGVQRMRLRRNSAATQDGCPFGTYETVAPAKPEPKRRTSLAKDTVHRPAKTDETRLQVEDKRTPTEHSTEKETIRRHSAASSAKGEHSEDRRLSVYEKDGEAATPNNDRMMRPEPAERRRQPVVNISSPRPASSAVQDKAPGQDDFPKDTTLRTPVPARRRRLSSTQLCIVPASALARPTDGDDSSHVEARPVSTAGVLVRSNGGQAFGGTPGGTWTHNACLLPNGDEPGRRAVAPRTRRPEPVPVHPRDKAIVSKQVGALVERSVVTPAVPHDGSLLPVPHRQCILRPSSAKTPPAPTSQNLSETDQISKTQTEVAVVVSPEEGSGITSLVDRPDSLEVAPVSSSEVTVSDEITRGSSPQRALVEAASGAPRKALERPRRTTGVRSMPSYPKKTKEGVSPGKIVEAGTRRWTIEQSSCATALHLDEFVNDSLETVRLPLEGATQDKGEQVTLPRACDSDLANLDSPEKGANSDVARTESKEMKVADLTAAMKQGTGKEKSEEPVALAAGESTQAALLERRAEPTAHSETVAPLEKADEPESPQQVADDSNKEQAGVRSENEKVTGTEESGKTTTVRESEANHKSVIRLPGDSVSAVKVLLMGEEASNASVLGESKADALSEVRRLEGADSARGHTPKGDDPDQGKDQRRTPAKAVRIEQRTSPTGNEQLPEAIRHLKRREVNVWLEDCRLACENLSSTAALVLVCFILFHVARPMYVREGSPVIVAQHDCSGQWCDRLGLRVLPNKSNQEKDPCESFHQRVCHEWNVGHENTTFDGSLIDSAFGYTRDRIYSSPMPAIIRNDLDQFVVFVRVCLEDSHFHAPLPEWMALIRYELRDDFLVMPHWNWPRMVRAVIKKSLVDGLQTIAGIRVGRPDKAEKPGLFLSVDGCLLSLLSVKTRETRVVASLLTEITNELPEFRDRTRALAHVKRIALAIARKRREVDRRRAFCQMLASLTRGVNAAFWVNEINRHVPADVRLEADCLVISYERVRPRDIFSALEQHPLDARALYINLLMVGQVLRFRHDLVASAQPKLRVCMLASHAAFRHLWVRLIMDVTHLHVQERYLGDLYEGIKEGLVADLEKRGGSETNKLAVQALVNKTRLRSISIPVIVREGDYDGPQLAVGYRLPQYFLQTLAFQTRRSVAFLVDEQSLTGGEDATSRRLPYSDKDLTIRVPFLLLFRPMFVVYHGEQFHNFATVGVLLAVHLIKQATTRSLLDLTAANRSTQCRIEQYLRVASAVGGQPVRPTLDEVFTFEVAVSAALRSMEKYVGLHMSPMEKLKHGQQLRRLFFERFCLLSCTLSEVHRVDSMPRCLLPLMNMAEFAEAYGCAPGSNMFPSHKCGEL